MVWVAFRFGQREVTTAVARGVRHGALVHAAARSVGPLRRGTPLDESPRSLLLLFSRHHGVRTGLILSAVLWQLERAMLAARRRAEGMLLESEQRFRLMVESVVDYAIFMLDAEGRVASWNAGAERILGYQADEIVGQRLARFYPHEDVQLASRSASCEVGERPRAASRRRAGAVRKDGSRVPRPRGRDRGARRAAARCSASPR